MAVSMCTPRCCLNIEARQPIQWAILDGETETGVTIMQMDAGLDTGDMLLVKKTPIDPEETAEMLFERLSALGAQALAEILPRLDDLHLMPQPAGDFGYAKMISKSMSPLIGAARQHSCTIRCGGCIPGPAPPRPLAARR